MEDNPADGRRDEMEVEDTERVKERSGAGNSNGSKRSAPAEKAVVGDRKGEAESGIGKDRAKESEKTYQKMVKHSSSLEGAVRRSMENVEVVEDLLGFPLPVGELLKRISSVKSTSTIDNPQKALFYSRVMFDISFRGVVWNAVENLYLRGEWDHLAGGRDGASGGTEGSGNISNPRFLAFLLRCNGLVCLAGNHVGVDGSDDPQGNRKAVGVVESALSQQGVVLRLYGYDPKVKGGGASPKKCRFTQLGRNLLVAYLVGQARKGVLRVPCSVRQAADLHDEFMVDIAEATEGALVVEKKKKGGDSGGDGNTEEEEEDGAATGADGSAGETEVPVPPLVGGRRGGVPGLLYEGLEPPPHAGPPLSEVKELMDQFIDPRIPTSECAGLVHPKTLRAEALPAELVRDFGFQATNEFLEDLANENVYIDVACGCTSQKDGGKPSDHEKQFRFTAKMVKQCKSLLPEFGVHVLVNLCSPHFQDRAVRNVRGGVPMMEGVAGRQHSLCRAASATAAETDPHAADFRAGPSILYAGQRASDFEFDLIKVGKFFMFHCETVALLAKAAGKDFHAYDARDVHVMAALVARACYAKHSDYSATLTRRVGSAGSENWEEVAYAIEGRSDGSCSVLAGQSRMLGGGKDVERPDDAVGNGGGGASLAASGGGGGPPFAGGGPEEVPLRVEAPDRNGDPPLDSPSYCLAKYAGMSDSDMVMTPTGRPKFSMEKRKELAKQVLQRLGLKPLVVSGEGEWKKRSYRLPTRTELQVFTAVFASIPTDLSEELSAALEEAAILLKYTDGDISLAELKLALNCCHLQGRFSQLSQHALRVLDEFLRKHGRMFLRIVYTLRMHCRGEAEFLTRFLTDVGRRAKVRRVSEFKWYDAESFFFLGDRRQLKPRWLVDGDAVPGKTFDSAMEEAWERVRLESGCVGSPKEGLVEENRYALVEANHRKIGERARTGKRKKALVDLKSDGFSAVYKTIPGEEYDSLFGMYRPGRVIGFKELDGEVLSSAPIAMKLLREERVLVRLLHKPKKKGSAKRKKKGDPSGKGGPENSSAQLARRDFVFYVPRSSAYADGELENVSYPEALDYVPSDVVYMENGMTVCDRSHRPWPIQNLLLLRIVVLQRTYKNDRDENLCSVLKALFRVRIGDRDGSGRGLWNGRNDLGCVSVAGVGGCPEESGSSPPDMARVDPNSPDVGLLLSQDICCAANQVLMHTVSKRRVVTVFASHELVAYALRRLGTEMRDLERYERDGVEEFPLTGGPERFPWMSKQGRKTLLRIAGREQLSEYRIRLGRLVYHLEMMREDQLLFLGPHVADGCQVNMGVSKRYLWRRYSGYGQQFLRHIRYMENPHLDVTFRPLFEWEDWRTFSESRSLSDFYVASTDVEGKNGIQTVVERSEREKCSVVLHKDAVTVREVMRDYVRNRDFLRLLPEAERKRYLESDEMQSFLSEDCSPYVPDWPESLERAPSAGDSGSESGSDAEPTSDEDLPLESNSEGESESDGARETPQAKPAARAATSPPPGTVRERDGGKKASCRPKVPGTVWEREGEKKASSPEAPFDPAAGARANVVPVTPPRRGNSKEKSASVAGERNDPEPFSNPGAEWDEESGVSKETNAAQNDSKSEGQSETSELAPLARTTDMRERVKSVSTDALNEETIRCGYVRTNAREVVELCSCVNWVGTHRFLGAGLRSRQGPAAPLEPAVTAGVVGAVLNLRSFPMAIPYQDEAHLLLRREGEVLGVCKGKSHEEIQRMVAKFTQRGVERASPTDDEMDSLRAKYNPEKDLERTKADRLLFGAIVLSVTGVANRFSLFRMYEEEATLRDMNQNPASKHRRRSVRILPGPNEAHKFLNFVMNTLSDPVSGRLSDWMSKQYLNSIPDEIKTFPKFSMFVLSVKGYLETIHDKVFRTGETPCRRRVVTGLALCLLRCLPSQDESTANWAKILFVAGKVISLLEMVYHGPSVFGEETTDSVFPGFGARGGMKLMAGDQQDLKCPPMSIEFQGIYRKCLDAVKVEFHDAMVCDDRLLALGCIRTESGRIVCMISGCPIGYVVFEHFLCKVYLVYSSTHPSRNGSARPFVDRAHLYPYKHPTWFSQRKAGSTNPFEDNSFRIIMNIMAQYFGICARQQLIAFPYTFRFRGELETAGSQFARDFGDGQQTV